MSGEPEKKPLSLKERMALKKKPVEEFHWAPTSIPQAQPFTPQTFTPQDISQQHDMTSAPQMEMPGNPYSQENFMGQMNNNMGGFQPNQPQQGFSEQNNQIGGYNPYNSNQQNQNNGMMNYGGQMNQFQAGMGNMNQFPSMNPQAQFGQAGGQQIGTMGTMPNPNMPMMNQFNNQGMSGNNQFNNMSNQFGGIQNQFGGMGGMNQFGGIAANPRANNMNYAQNANTMFTGNWEDELQTGGGEGEVVNEDADNNLYYNNKDGGDANQDKKRKKKKKKGKGETHPTKDDEEKKKAKDEKKEKKILVKTLKTEEVIDFDKIRRDKRELVFDEEKDPMNIIIIGHVDSGKSTICGNILLKTGKVDEEELRRYEVEAKEKDRESWMMAYVMDINEEERAKGKTVEVGKASFDLKTKRYTILDCPGHRNYVPNMIAGATQADVAALVVSAKSGEFEAGFERGGQTMEHTILARYLGSEYLVIIINKMDECNWGKERFDYIKKNLLPFLKDICGYDIEKQIVFVPVDGLKGNNILEPIGKEACPWYDGPTLLQVFDDVPKLERPNVNVLRIPIFDKIKERGETLLYGKIVTGAIKEKMKCVIMPKGQEITIDKFYDSEDKELALAEAGDNIKLSIKGINDVEDLKRGNVICGVQFKCFTCYEFIAEIRVMDLPDKKKIISDAFPAVMHMHCIQEEVEIKKVISSLDDPTRKGKIFLRSQESGTVRIVCQTMLCLEKYDEFPELARFTLRSESWTIAVGKVLKIKPIDRKELEHTSYYMNQQKLQAESNN